MARSIVLVVDDEEEHRHLTSFLLRNEYEVRTAGNGDQALAIAAEVDIDLALVDQRMPGMSGIEVLAALGERQPECIRFLVTAYSEPATLADAINVAEVYRFLAKPIDPQMLRIDLRRALEHREAKRHLAKAEKLSLLGALAGSVAHDLRNYTQILRLLPDILLHATDLSVVRRTANELRHVDANISQLAAELLAFVRGESPRYELEFGALGDLVREVVGIETQMPVFEERRVKLTVAPDLPAVRLSKPRCSRLVANLMQNAAQATTCGGNIEVQVRRGEMNVELVVEDDGPGVPDRLRDRIFEPLFTTKAERGVGLGLSICKSIVEGHGGTLELAPPEDKGARFVARFPVM